MESGAEQRRLSDQQVENFYHDHFVVDQVRDFRELVSTPPAAGRVIVDVGGGCGFFADLLQRETGCRVRVLDYDQKSVDACHQHGIDAVRGDALEPSFAGDEDMASFNLVLHHLVCASSAATRRMQSRALEVWHPRVRNLFVNEYIYESYVANLSGWLIYLVTRGRVLSAVVSALSRLVPALRANTLGVGVRFRAHEEWVRLFHDAGYEVVSRARGVPERVAPPWRLLLIRQIRRDSFLLRPRSRSADGSR
jgi:hypothetical protein